MDKLFRQEAGIPIGDIDDLICTTTAKQPILFQTKTNKTMQDLLYD